MACPWRADAIEQLRRAGVAGAVLALRATGPGDADVSTQPGVDLLRHHVRGTRPGVDALLDLLVGAVVLAPDWAAAVDAAVADPGAVVVSRDGDRLGPSGWRIGGSAAGATGAALAEAHRRAEAAAVEADAAAARLVTLDRERDTAREAELEARQAAERATQPASGRAGEITRLTVDHDDATAEADALAVHVDELVGRVARDRSRLVELEEALPALESEEAEAADQVVAMTDARAELEARASEVASLRSDIEVRSAGLGERRAMLTRRAAEVEERLQRDEVQRREAEVRRVEHDHAALALDRLHQLVTDRLGFLDGRVVELREQRQRQSEASRQVAERLEGLRGERGGHERRVGVEPRRRAARRARGRRGAGPIGAGRRVAAQRPRL